MRDAHDVVVCVTKQRCSRTMHFDIVLNFLATPKNIYMCGSCTTISRIEEICDDGNYFSMLCVKLLPLLQQDAATHLFILCVRTESCEAVEENVINIKFCLSLRIYFVDALVLFSFSFFLLNFLENTSFHPLALLLLPFCRCTISVPILQCCLYFSHSVLIKLDGT